MNTKIENAKKNLFNAQLEAYAAVAVSKHMTKNNHPDHAEQEEEAHRLILAQDFAEDVLAELEEAQALIDAGTK